VFFNAVIAYAARQDLFPLRIGERRRLVQVRFHAGTRNQAPFAARLASHFSPVNFRIGPDGTPRSLFLHDDDHPETGLTALHLGKRICSALQWHGLDHRAYIFEDAESQRIFVIDRGPGERSFDRAGTKKEREQV
jgi:hypothetical protein